MYLISISIIVLSILGVFVIVGRKIRRSSGVAREEKSGEGGNARKDQGLVYPEFNETDGKKKGFPFVGKIFHLGEGDTVFVGMEKFFRKVRVRLMKTENWLASMSNRLHEKARERRASRIEETEEARQESSLSRSEASKEDGSGPTLAALNQTNTDFDENYWIRVLKEDEKNPYPYKKLGEIYLARGYFKEAREVLRCALKINPEDLEAKAKFEELRGKRTKRVKAA